MVALNQRRSIAHIVHENLQPIYMDFSGTMLFGVLTAFVWHYAAKLWFILLALGFVIYSAFQLTTRLTHETESALKTIVDVVDERDPYTYKHSLLVARYSRMVAEQMIRDPAEVDVIERAAYLHDIGKIGIDDQSLQKPSALTGEELELMKLHPAIGARILGSFSQFKDGIEIVLAHQEWYDGSGYPRGLRGDAIPLGARIIAVTDAYVAMTTDRPYRRAMGQEAALEVLRDGMGTQFDPVICAFFMKCVLDSRSSASSQFAEITRLPEPRQRTAPG
jgi:putative nucleotidyltransferase with HDIG domain